MVGTITVVVTACCSHNSSTRPGSKSERNTDTPPCAGTPSIPPIDAAWNIGVWCKNTSSRLNRHTCITWYRLSISARWSSSTPFGRPVVPPVYMRIAASSSSGSSGIRGSEPARSSSYETSCGPSPSPIMHDVFDVGRGAHLVDHGREVLVGEADLRTGVGEDVLELLGREPQVQRVDDPGPEERGVVALEELVAVERHHREAVVRRNAETAQPRREPGDAVEMLGERRAVLAVEEAEPIGVALHRGEQQAVIDELFHDPIPPCARRRRRGSTLVGAGATMAGDDRDHRAPQRIRTVEPRRRQPPQRLRAGERGVVRRVRRGARRPGRAHPRRGHTGRRGLAVAVQQPRDPRTTDRRRPRRPRSHPAVLRHRPGDTVPPRQRVAHPEPGTDRLRADGTPAADGPARGRGVSRRRRRNCASCASTTTAPRSTTNTR